MTLRELREQLKAAYALATVDYTESSKNRNMRQFWVKVNYTLSKTNWNSRVDPNLHRFNQLGLIYYHAKKHGMQSAMLLRLKSI